MKTLKFLIPLTTIVLILSCSKNDYLKGGTLHNAKVNMTTYDYLKSHSTGLFDTLLLIVDKAGLKDKINQQGISFFAPTDYAIKSYLDKRAQDEQRIDPFRQWTIDSLLKYDISKFTDSLNIYIVPSIIDYNNLTQNGTLYNTQKSGTTCVVSFEETFDSGLGYNYNVSDPPRIMYYTIVLQPLSSPIIASEISSEDGIRTRVQTSGIQSTTGMIHVLNNSHTLFFKR